MSDWLTKRLSPIKKITTRWLELAEAIQTFWEENFDEIYDELESLKSIYTATTENQILLAKEWGLYEDSLAEENLPISIAARRMEIYQKETDVPLVRAMARLGFPGVWLPLYAPKNINYGTAFYAEEELAAAGLTIDAETNGAFLTSRARMYLDISNQMMPGGIEIARRRIMQMKPLHIVFDGFTYELEVWLVIFADSDIDFAFKMTKPTEFSFKWGTQARLDGTWTVSDDTTVTLGGYALLVDSKVTTKFELNVTPTCEIAITYS